MNNKDNVITEQSNPFAGTFAFFQTLNLTHKKQKSLQANAQGQCLMTRQTFDRKEAQQVTAVWRNGGFSAFVLVRGTRNEIQNTIKLHSLNP